MSGALPITTASMSGQSSSASTIARSAASRTRPAIDTSARFDWCFVWPTPITAQRSPINLPRDHMVALASDRDTRPADARSTAARATLAVRSCPLHHADEVLLEARALRGVRDNPLRGSVDDSARRLSDPDQAGRHDRVRAQRAA